MKKMTIVSLVVTTLLIIALIAVIVVDPHKYREPNNLSTTQQYEARGDQERPAEPRGERGGFRRERGEIDDELRGERGERGDELRGEKGRFQAQQIEQLLGLEGDRLEQFQQLYTEYLEATTPPRGEKSPFGTAANMNQLTEEEIDASIRESFDRSIAVVKAKEEYYARFREFLSPREVAMMYEVERRTTERFVDELRRRTEQHAKQTTNNPR